MAMYPMVLFTIDIVYIKKPDIYRKYKSQNTYVMRTKAVSKDLEKLLKEGEEFKESLLSISKE